MKPSRAFSTDPRGALQAGFTLIEILIAITLMALISAVMVESFRYAQRTYQGSYQLHEKDGEVFAAQRFLREILESTSPGTQGGLPVTTGPFEGDLNDLVFTAPALRAFQSVGTSRYELTTARSVDHPELRDLVVKWRPDAGTQTQLAQDEIETLVSGIKSAHWSYWSVDNAAFTGETQREWRDEWKGSSELPALVRLRVEFAQDDGRRWPEFLVRLRLTHGASCVFDVVAQSCRS